MPGRGLEPLRISPPDPKSGASANFATLAIRFRSVNSQLAIANDGGSRRGLIIADEAPDGAGLAQVEDVAGLAGLAATGAGAFFFAAASAAAVSFASTSAASVGEMRR